MKPEFTELVLKNCPRLFSHLNQNEFSQSFGSFNRNFWHYKLVDFPSAVYQVGALITALLYKNNFPGNFYFRQKKILNWTIAAIAYWRKLISADGSFSEWYPNERSHVATAFSSYAISEALLVLGSEVPEKERKNTLRVLEKAGDYLNENPETVVTNHQAGAVMALYNLYLLSGKREFKAASKKQLKILLNKQSTEGWFPEYGGADLGYLSLTVSYLAKYWQKTKDEQVLKTLRRAVSFMSYFIHPDGSFGGEYGSRGTKFLMTAGLATLSPVIPLAGYLLDNYQPVDSYDDRYLIFFFLPDWITTYIQTQNREPRTKNLNQFGQLDQFDQSFPNAGIRVVKNKNYYCIISYKKNGVVKVFKNGNLVFSDTGWWGRLDNGKIISSQWLNQEQTGLSIKTKFCQFNFPLMGKKILALRLFNYTLGKLGLVVRLFDWWLKKKYLAAVEKAAVFLTREIKLMEKRVLIQDELTLGPNLFLTSLKRTTNYSQKYTPTCQFFTPADLFVPEMGSGQARTKDFAKILNRKRKIKVRTII